ncbi:MAG TPA: hypothetical protein VH349_08995 [Ktedonobacterales bacterium]|jgi:hypothetical protein
MQPMTANDYFVLAAALALVGPPVLWLFTRFSIFYVRFPWPPFGRKLPPWSMAGWGWACVACGLGAIALLLQGLRLAVEAPALVIDLMTWVEVMSICLAVTISALVALLVPKR